MSFQLRLSVRARLDAYAHSHRQSRSAVIESILERVLANADDQAEAGGEAA